MRAIARPSGFLIVLALVAALASSPGAAQPRSLSEAERAEMREEASAARDQPLIGSSLMDATYARWGGRCRWWRTHLRRAADDLEFYKRYLRANPDTDKLSQADIDHAQRALDRAKRQPCDPNPEERQLMTEAAGLPARTGPVEPMPSELQPDASIQQRYEEIDSALRAIFRDRTKCDVETARRWMENYRRLLREVRLRRDAALGAGGFSQTDAWEANNAYWTMRSIVEVAEDEFLRYRLRCARQSSEEDPETAGAEEEMPTEGDEGETPTEGAERRSSCIPRTGGEFCNRIPIGEDGWPIWEAEETQQAIAEWRERNRGRPLPSAIDDPFRSICPNPDAVGHLEAIDDIELEIQLELLFSFGGCGEFFNKATIGVLTFDPSPEEAAEIQKWTLENVIRGTPTPEELFDLDEDEQAMLDVHNEARHAFGVDPLIWDLRLAAGAAEYAKQLPEIGSLAHSPREGREDQRENLLAANVGSSSPVDMILVMVDEKKFFEPGIYPDVSTTGDWSALAHYTQIVWPWTTHVGCAIESGEFFDYAVCRYSPPGNRDGDPLYPGGIVPPPPR